MGRISGKKRVRLRFAMFSSESVTARNSPAGSSTRATSAKKVR
jgi:hypothetical protein